MNCPKDNTELEFIDGDFTTGVTAPDGGKETIYEQGWGCPQCGTIYSESDFEEEGV